MSETHRLSASAQTMLVTEVVRRAEPGWPRWFIAVDIDGEQRHLPLPWINAVAPVFEGSRGFVKMDPRRAREAAEDRLCVICGLELGVSRVMGAFGSNVEIPHEVLLTDGPPGHPRCIALAARHCPHLRRQWENTPAPDDVIIAYVYEGAGPAAIPVPSEKDGDSLPWIAAPGSIRLTLGELREMARRDPLGEQSLTE